MWLYAAERDGSCGVRENLRLLPKNAHQAILDSLEGNHKHPAREFGNAGYSPHRDEAPTASISTQRGR
jgi:phospholipid/cholesterol/gamma-HCH transport system ATP-binding protein